MIRSSSFLIVMLALVALLTPTIVSGSSAFALPAGSYEVRLTADNGDICVEQATKPAQFKTCEMQGGKRLVPCHPDMGVFPTSAPAFTGSCTQLRPAWQSEVVRPQASPEIHSPPPRA